MLNIYKIISRSRLILFIIFFLVSIFVFSDEMNHGFKKGFFLCFDVLIPSLFPFMAISSFISNSGGCKKFDKIFAPITRALFGLPGCTVVTIFLGFIGGYPTGAIGIANLLKNKLISQGQAKRMLLFLVNSGPAFVVTAIGMRALHSVNLGIVLFLAQTLAAIFLGIITKYLFKDFIFEKSSVNTLKSSVSFSDSFVKSVKESSQNIFNMCSFVVLFSSFMEIIKNEVFLNYITSIFNFISVSKNVGISVILSIFEVTTGCYSACEAKAPLGLISFFLAFGGICVHLQIFSCVDKVNFSKIKFILFRVLHGLLSIPICYLLLPFFNCSVQTFNSFVTEYVTCDLTSSGLAIVFLCLCFLNTLTSDSINFKKE